MFCLFLPAGKNAILLGNPEENLHTDRYMSKIPVKIKGKFCAVIALRLIVELKV